MTGPLEEREALIPAYITLRHELNEAEQANILEAEEWAYARKRDVLSERFLTDLHIQMFGRDRKTACSITDEPTARLLCTLCS